MTACVLYYFFLLLLSPPPKKKVLAQPQLILEIVLTLPKLFVKKSLCPVLVCTGPSPQINIARSLKLPIRYPFHEI
jgi:hypothetical protein